MNNINFSSKFSSWIPSSGSPSDFISRLDRRLVLVAPTIFTGVLACYSYNKYSCNFSISNPNTGMMQALDAHQLSPRQRLPLSSSAEENETDGSSSTQKSSPDMPFASPHFNYNPNFIGVNPSGSVAAKTTQSSTPPIVEQSPPGYINQLVLNSDSNITLLKPISKKDEIELTLGMERDEVGLFGVKVVVVNKDEHVYLHTDRLFPCIAAMAYSELANGRRLLGITHIVPGEYNNDIETLQKFIKTIENHPEFNGEKVQFYFAGGRDCEVSSSYNSERYEKLVFEALKVRFIVLSGVLFDPFKLSSSINDSLDWPCPSEELIKLKNEDLSTYNLMRKNMKKSRHLLDLLSCRAGITSEGVPTVRRQLDISFDYDLYNFSNYRAIKQHCSSVLGVNTSEMTPGQFD